MRDLWIDYTIFMVIILTSFVLTVYRNLSGRTEKTKSDYVLADERSISLWTMLVSLAKGFLGIRVFLGYPSELFYRGCELWETLYGISLAFPIVAYFFVPVYLSLNITSVYEYLDMRFKSKLIRCLASAAFVIRSLLILGITTFTPCIAIKTIIGIPFYVSITCMTLLSMLFMCSGGFTSALMGDVVQCILMVIICLIVIVVGIIEAGGPFNVIKISHERGRLNFLNFDLDPTKRATTISALLGHLFISVSMYGCQQNFIQRYISMKSKEKVIRMLILSIPFTVIMMSMPWIVGMVILTQYVDCDPKKLGYIQDIDELFPFYLEDTFLFVPGFLGIVLAVLFNGSLSAIVSNLNSVATVLWEDFVSHLHMFKNISDNKQVWSLKIISVCCSLIIMTVTFCISELTGIIEISIIMISATSGPLLGIFILALFFPSVNWKGAVIGMISGVLVIAWITLGAATLPKSPTVYLPTSTNQCKNDTFDDSVVKHRFSVMNEESISSEAEINQMRIANSSKSDIRHTLAEENILNSIYKVTYLYYSIIGTGATVITGIIFSIVSGSHAENYIYEEHLVHPVIHKWRPYHVPVSLEIK
ncbi:hypothetical protein PGB90_000639 [Kerria lacca]